ncbi:MAG: hypothetical protein HRT53_13960 [Colwellia sp.]|nr:hypothetical protein [Colwellia sp.]
MGIIFALIIALVIIVVAVGAIQQHKEKQEKENRLKASKQKAIIDESEELIVNLANLPSNPTVINILNRRSLNAARAMKEILPDSKSIRNKVGELEARLNASEDLAGAHSEKEEKFVLPDNEQQLVSILQCIKRLRATLKHEQAKGALDAQTFTHEDKKLDAIQLQIGVESLLKRGNMAYQKEMLGSARQYFEKAMQTLSAHPIQTEYIANKKAEVTSQLEEITNALKSTNAKDAAKKAKDQEDDLDMLFQPKKKW